MAADSLDILDPAPTVVQFRGERLEILPLTIGQLPAFSRLVRPIIAEMLGGQHPQWAGDDNTMLVELLELHGEAIIQAVAIAARRPVEFIADNKDSAELLALAYTIVGANRDFFTRAMKAIMSAQSLARDLPSSTAGLTTSSTSSDRAIH